MSYAQNVTGGLAAHEREEWNRAWLQCRYDYRQRSWSLAADADLHPESLAASLPLLVRGLIAQESGGSQLPVRRASPAEPAPEKSGRGIIFKSKGVVQRAANLLRRPPHARQENL
jgi:hypothetical protein